MSKLLYAQIWQSGSPRCHNPGCENHLSSTQETIYVVNQNRVVGFCSIECLITYTDRYKTNREVNARIEKQDMLRELGYKKLRK